MSGAGTAKVEVVPQIADIPAETWDACANPDPAIYNPFLAHAFLKALAARWGAACSNALLRSSASAENNFPVGIAKWRVSIPEEPERTVSRIFADRRLSEARNGLDLAICQHSLCV